MALLRTLPPPCGVLRAGPRRGPVPRVSGFPPRWELADLASLLAIARGSLVRVRVRGRGRLPGAGRPSPALLISWFFAVLRGFLMIVLLLIVGSSPP
ncbi:hypothetical protein [Nocardiopsis halotolerans]|uniref:hypothetical protein n=1 Tax=Nocardiopsis halotolerans TaxID=124252 RepID=UPI00034B37FC|nr:hypothetical protein [Nocardiopsis halotolerans]